MSPQCAAPHPAPELPPVGTALAASFRRNPRPFLAVEGESNVRERGGDGGKDLAWTELQARFFTPRRAAEVAAEPAEAVGV